MTVRYRFHTLLGSGEKVAVWIDGRLVHWAGFPENRSFGTNLVAGHQHRIRVDYINSDGRAELKRLWSSRVMGPISHNIKRLHPDTTAVREIQ
jgi:alpha-L-fucosidase